MGTFAGATETYGDPVAFVHPVDNDFAKARFSDAVRDPRMKLTDEQMRDMQKKIDDLYYLMKLGQEQGGKCKQDLFTVAERRYQYSPTPAKHNHTGVYDDCPDNGN